MRCVIYGCEIMKGEETVEYIFRGLYINGLENICRKNIVVV